jgi:hypothetical protein
MVNPSNISRDRPHLRSLIGEIDHDLIHIAPSPTLRRVIALDDRVLGRMEMGRGMAKGRVIATADMTAGSA